MKITILHRLAITYITFFFPQIFAPPKAIQVLISNKYLPHYLSQCPQSETKSSLFPGKGDVRRTTASPVVPCYNFKSCQDHEEVPPPLTSDWPKQNSFCYASLLLVYGVVSKETGPDTSGGVSRQVKNRSVLSDVKSCFCVIKLNRKT